jgi:proline iminopeptidase
MERITPAPAVSSLVGRKGLYPDNEPFAHGWLQTGGPHEIFYEECGRPDGKAAVILHGGPGGAINPTMRRFMDPSRWRMALFDQRGCGRSRPNASLEDNTTWSLIEDIERLREHLGVEKWTVFGGSWGSTLALAYAIKHPDRVAGLVLRGVFLLTERELGWFYQDGASMMFPDAWERFCAPIPPEERDDMIGAYPGASGKATPSRSAARRPGPRSSTRSTSPSPSRASSATSSPTAASSRKTAGS